MNSNRKQKQMEQKPKSGNKLYCMECGESHGTLHKIKAKNGKKGYLCECCFEDYKLNN